MPPDQTKTQPETFLEKGKAKIKKAVVQTLDKRQGAQEVVRLIDQLQKVIIIYQVRAGNHRIRAGLTRAMVAVPAAIDLRPGHAAGGKLLRVVFASRLTGRLSIQVFIRYVSEAQRGETTRTIFGPRANALVENAGGGWKN